MKRRTVYVTYTVGRTTQAEFARVLGVNKKTGKVWVKLGSKLWPGETRLLDPSQIEEV